MRPSRSLASTVAAIGSLAGLACAPAEPPTDVPPIEERSLTFLADGLEAAAGDLDAAREALDAEEVEKTTAALDGAAASVDGLRHYFLPLLSARESAHRARHAWSRGDADSVRSYLSEIEERLAEVSHGAGAEAAERMAEPLAAVQQIDLALGGEAEPTAVRDQLAELERRINNLAVKGGLVVRPAANG